MGTTVFKICICRDMLSVSCADPEGGDRGVLNPPPPKISEYKNNNYCLLIIAGLR